MRRVLSGGPGSVGSSTRLLKINPLGIGTPLQECLPSYMDRLAEAHGLKNSTFLVREVSSTFTNPFTARHGAQCLYVRKYSQSLLVANEGTSRVSDFLALNTGSPAVKLLAQPVLSKRIKIHTRDLVAWCPECLSHQMSRRGDIYRPFLWSISAVQCCPIHKSALRTNCPACAATFHHIDTNHFGNACGQCGCRLTQAIRASSIHPNDWKLFCASAIFDLLQWSAKESADIRAAQFCENVALAVRAVGSIQHLATALGLSRHRISDWRRESVRPEIEALCCFSYVFEIPLKSLLADRLTPEDFTIRRLIPTVAVRVRLVERSPDDKVILRSLHKAASTSLSPPPSLATVARRLGMHSSSLLRRFPRDAAPIVRNHRTFVARAAKIKMTVKKRCVQHAKTIVLAKGENASKRQVFAVLNPQSKISLREVGYILDTLSHEH